MSKLQLEGTSLSVERPERRIHREKAGIMPPAPVCSSFFEQTAALVSEANGRAAFLVFGEKWTGSNTGNGFTRRRGDAEGDFDTLNSAAQRL